MHQWEDSIGRNALPKPTTAMPNEGVPSQLFPTYIDRKVCWAEIHAKGSKNTGQWAPNTIVSPSLYGIDNRRYRSRATLLCFLCIQIQIRRSPPALSPNTQTSSPQPCQVRLGHITLGWLLLQRRPDTKRISSPRMLLSSTSLKSRTSVPILLLHLSG